MDPIVEIIWMSGSLDEARKVSRLLVEERLVFTVQIIPWVESIYLLDGKLETTQESRIVMKAKKVHFEQIVEKISALTTYDVPEISMHTLDEVGGAFQSWITK